MRKFVFRASVVIERLIKPYNVNIEGRFGRWLRRHDRNYYNRRHEEIEKWQVDLINTKNGVIKNLKFPTTQAIFAAIKVNDYGVRDIQSCHFSHREIYMFATSTMTNILALPKVIQHGYIFQKKYCLVERNPLIFLIMSEIPIHLDFLLYIMMKPGFNFDEDIGSLISGNHRLLINTSKVSDISYLINQYPVQIKQLVDHRYLGLTEPQKSHLALVS